MENFQIYRSGELDPAFARQQRVEALHGVLGSAANTFTSVVQKGAETAGKLALFMYASAYDSMYQTDYREQLSERWDMFTGDTTLN